MHLFRFLAPAFSFISLLPVRTLSSPASLPDKPTIILVPGAFHRAAVFDLVIDQLRQAQYRNAIAVDLPSVGAVVGRDRDIEAVRSVLLKQLQDDKDVLLVGNSYGATVISEAVKGLKDLRDLKDRQAASRPGPSQARLGRILGLVFLSGYIPYISEVTHPETKPPIEKVAPPFFRFDADGRVYWDNDLANWPPAKTFYNSLPPQDAEYWSSRLQFSSYDALAANATYIPYTGDFRCTYVMGKQDNSVPMEWAQTFVDQPDADFAVEIMDTDHVPMLSQPAAVANLLRRTAEGH